MSKLVVVLMLAGIASAQDWKLGTLQTVLSAGANLEDGRNGYQPSLSLGLDIGLTRYVATTSSYTWNRSEFQAIRTTRVDIEHSVAFHDLLGGVRIHAPLGRLQPFVAGLAGMTTATERFSINQSDARDRLFRPAAGLGAGLELRVFRGLSIRADARAIRARDFGWHGTVGFGIAYREHPRGYQ